MMRVNCWESKNKFMPRRKEVREESFENRKVYRRKD
jgi:hypothetical protein